MAFCEQCGNNMSETAKFCRKCGAAAAPEQTQAPPAEPVAASTEAPPLAASSDGVSPAQKAFNAGLACNEAERYDESIAHFTEAVRLAPESAGAYYYRGVVYYIKEQYDSAIADLTQAIRLAPNEAGHYCARGNVYLAKGDLASARADLERGLQIDPNDETLAELAEAFQEASGQGGYMPASASCAQCGAPLDEDEVFCANCGAKVGAMPFRAPIMQDDTFLSVASDVVYINEEEGKKRVMNNGKLYAKLLTKFMTDTNLNDLEDFVFALDLKKALIAAQTIKGIAANLSLPELLNQSLDVENQIKSKSLKVDSLEKLKTCFTETLVEVGKVIAHYA